MYAALPRLELMVSRASLAAVEYYHYTDGRMLLKRSSLALAHSCVVRLRCWRIAPRRAARAAPARQAMNASRNLDRAAAAHLRVHERA